jgi:hypothetical protein
MPQKAFTVLTLGGLIAAVTFSPCEARLTQLVISPTEIVGGGADIGAAAVPEPAAGAMLVVGLVLLAAAERRLPRTA